MNPRELLETGPAADAAGGTPGVGGSENKGTYYRRGGGASLPLAFRLTPYSRRARGILPVEWKGTQGQQWTELLTQGSTHPRHKLFILKSWAHPVLILHPPHICVVKDKITSAFLASPAASATVLSGFQSTRVICERHPPSKPTGSSPGH